MSISKTLAIKSNWRRLKRLWRKKELATEQDKKAMSLMLLQIKRSQLDLDLNK